MSLLLLDVFAFSVFLQKDRLLVNKLQFWLNGSLWFDGY